MADPFLGEIKMAAFSFAPRGWALCDGTTLPTNQNQALYSLIGAYFGGNTSNFALPDLRGRTPVFYDATTHVGSFGGSETVTLTLPQLPTHTHLAQGTNVAADRVSVGVDATALYATGNYQSAYANASGTKVPMNTGVLLPAGGDGAHSNIQPSLVVNFIIATSGTYPQRP